MKQVVDYSGAYFDFGIVFSFDNAHPGKNIPQINNSNANEKAQNPLAEKANSDLPTLPGENVYADLITKGDESFGLKDYEGALAYYKQAASAQETAEVYRKIGTCNYYLKNKQATIDAYEKSIELNPKDTTLKSWLEKYKK